MLVLIGRRPAADDESSHHSPEGGRTVVYRDCPLRLREPKQPRRWSRSAGPSNRCSNADEVMTIQQRSNRERPLDPFARKYRSVMVLGPCDVDFIELCWRLKATCGRILTCSIYRGNESHIEVRASFGEDDVLWSCWTTDISSAHDLAAEWREWMTRSGTFADVRRIGRYFTRRFQHTHRSAGVQSASVFARVKTRS